VKTYNLVYVQSWWEVTKKIMIDCFLRKVSIFMYLTGVFRTEDLMEKTL